MNSWDFVPSVAVKHNTAYRRMLQQAAKHDPFVDLPWLVHGNDEAVSGIFVNDDLILNTRKFFCECMALGGYVHSEVKGPVCSLSDKKSMQESLTDFPDWLATQSIHGIFAEGSQDSPEIRELSAVFEAAGWSVSCLKGKTRAVLNLPPYSEGKDFGDVLRGINAKEFRSLRSSERKVQASGPVEVIQTHGVISEQELAMCQVVEKASWKADNGIFTADIFEATKEALQSNTTLTSILKIDGNPVAWDIDILHNDVSYSYNRAYDTEFKALAPGKLLHYKNIEFAWKRGICRFELLGDIDAFKGRVANEFHPRVRLICFSGKAQGRLLKLGHSCFLSAKKMLKSLK